MAGIQGNHTAAAAFEGDPAAASSHTPATMPAPPAGSAAASLLIAASALAQTPTQSVSSALLDKVHMAAAEGRLRQGRRGSVNDGLEGIQESIATSFSSRSNVMADAALHAMAAGSSMGSLPGAVGGTASASSSFALEPQAQDHHIQRPQDGAPLQNAGMTGGQMPADLASQVPAAGLTLPPDAESSLSSLFPQSQAQREVGQIAASTAAHEYVEQSLARLPSILADPSSNAIQWDDTNPFQGVPSTPMMPTASLAMISPPDVVMGLRTPFAAEQSATVLAQRHSATASRPFQPRYRLAPQEYQILASAAAVATAALTTASTVNGITAGTGFVSSDAAIDADPLPHGTVTRALTAVEQDEIAATLRAWAGLEGSERQEQAREHLQSLQGANAGEATALAAQSIGGPGLSGISGAEVKYFPPDFARHYQSQLTALAAGYYNKLHTEGLTQSQWAPAASTLGAGPGAGPSAPQPPTSTQALSSPPIRDQLLQYAHQLYAKGSKVVPAEGSDTATASTDAQATQGAPKSAPQTKTELHPQLLPMLHTLHNFHPQHLPTLLLLSCAYYSIGDLAASLWYNKMILALDPNYVESMSNIGTTLRALGRWSEAESWWWRAIKLRPGYWDAYENLLGVLCSPQQIPPSVSEYQNAQRIIEEGVLPSSPRPQLRKPEQHPPRFEEALALCEFVEGNIMSKRQSPGERRHRKVPSNSSASLVASTLPKPMPMHLPLSQFSRLQNLYYAKGNLKYVINGMGSVPALKEYEHAVEIMLSPSEDNRYSVQDLVISACVCGILSLGASPSGPHSANAAEEVAGAIGIDVGNHEQVKLASNGQFNVLCPGGGLLRLVRQSGDAIVNTLLRLGGGTHLPILFLIPKAAEQLVKIIFAETDGAPPSPVEGARRTGADASAIQQTIQQASMMTSTVLLTLAKLIQDASSSAIASPHGAMTVGSLQPSTSLVLSLYFLSISLNPAASTANNLGILLSAIPITTMVTGSNGERKKLNGQALAGEYYTYGLKLDAKHPHLYTNLGSLLKDLNHLPDAIQMYEKAIACNPSFDVALANLGNAIKDQGRTQESVQYYRRAVQVNPKFPEALCGLVNALLAICEWDDVYSDDDEGNKGLMKEVKTLLDRQLEEGSMYGAGALSAGKRPQDWVELLAQAHGHVDTDFRQRWLERVSAIAEIGPELRPRKINEGSFIIRIIERMTREAQRRWYRDSYESRLSTTSALPAIVPQPSDFAKYKRVPLPVVLSTPSVPTVLPFHTFTLKIPPRQIRLISHRTALRISQTTLAQQWVPAHVYPPPAPPAPRIKIGYVSSDFNNHPLAHLMQSCFGFHDREKFEVHLYATSASDNSPYRQKIEKEAEHFVDVSSWTTPAIITRILADGIHILMNLNGYTKGARNEIFAARPCPVQMEFMGFAGGLASGWTDWVVVDPIVCPPQVTSTERWRETRREKRNSSLKACAGPTDFFGDLDPESDCQDWEYTEKFIYMPDTYFVNDHRQGFREPKERKGLDGSTVVRPHEMSDDEAWCEEEQRRWQARKELWPSLPDDYIIFCDFNQLYKIEPSNFRLWLRILARVPKSILWLLRFPAAGEANLLRFAKREFGTEVAARVVFTDVAPKGVHIQRGRIADLFLDSLECGAHTTSADILWSGTPVLTWPKYEHKMASRVAASIVSATGYAQQMVVASAQEYEDRAVALAESLSYTYVDEQEEAIKVQTPRTAPEAKVTAEALHFNNTSAAAALHVAASTSSTKNGTEAQAGTKTSQNPAPANVKAVATEQAGKVDARANGQITPRDHSSEVLPERSTIELAATGAIAPAGTVSRRAHGELADLRRRLFLTRDANTLFDTRRWMRNLEQGYTEAWRRWVLGTDTEESLAWADLDEDDPAKKSGHIWVKDK